jgi:hypothetical protein
LFAVNPEGMQGLSSGKLGSSTTADVPTPPTVVVSNLTNTSMIISFAQPEGNGQPATTFDAFVCYAGTDDCPWSSKGLTIASELCEDYPGWEYDNKLSCSQMVGIYAPLCDSPLGAGDWDGGTGVLGAEACCNTCGGTGGIKGNAVSMVEPTGLIPGRNYTVQVEAFNSKGSSGNTTVYEADGVTPKVFTTPAPPMKPDPVFRAQTLDGLDYAVSIHVMWREPFDNGVPIEKYYLDMPLDFAEPLELDYHVAPQYILGPLVPGTTHDFRVMAKNAEGDSAYSDKFSWSTEEAAPGKPVAPPSLTDENGCSETDARILT